jgi:hypothetical protein
MADTMLDNSRRDAGTNRSRRIIVIVIIGTLDQRRILAPEVAKAASLHGQAAWQTPTASAHHVRRVIMSMPPPRSVSGAARLPIGHTPGILLVRPKWRQAEFAVSCDASILGAS